MSELIVRGAGALTTQVLGEFFWTVTRRLPVPLSKQQAASALTQMVDVWPVLGVPVAVSLEAARCSAMHDLAYWDAQLWATAKLNGIALVLSEDFADGCVIEGVRFANPFADGFDLDAVLAESG